MGIDYVYVNHSKKQYFDIGLFGESCRKRAAGFGAGSRALALLISDRGSWNSDAIEMLDDLTDESFRVAEDYTRINVEAELMILDVDGVDYFDRESELDFVTFSHLCLYAMILHRTDVIGLLDKKYDPGGWQKKFRDSYRGHATRMENEIAEAKGRSLEIYRR